MFLDGPRGEGGGVKLPACAGMVPASVPTFFFAHITLESSVPSPLVELQQCPIAANSCGVILGQSCSPGPSAASGKAVVLQ